MICRLCRSDEYSIKAKNLGKLFKYSTRHYAHFTCWMKKNGADGFKELSSWKLKQFPVLPAKELGLLKALEDAVKQAELREGVDTTTVKAARLTQRLDTRIANLRERENDLVNAIAKNKTGKPQIDQVGLISVESPAADAEIIADWEIRLDKLRESIADYEEIKTLVKKALGVA